MHFAERPNEGCDVDAVAFGQHVGAVSAVVGLDGRSGYRQAGRTDGLNLFLKGGTHHAFEVFEGDVLGVPFCA